MQDIIARNGLETPEPVGAEIKGLFNSICFGNGDFISLATKYSRLVMFPRS